MAGRKTYRRRTCPFQRQVRRFGRRIGAALSAAAVLCALVLTLGGRLGWPVPSWNEVYRAFGLGPSAVPAAGYGSDS